MSIAHVGPVVREPAGRDCVSATLNEVAVTFTLFVSPKV